MDEVDEGGGRRRRRRRRREETERSDRSDRSDEKGWGCIEGPVDLMGKLYEDFRCINVEDGLPISGEVVSYFGIIECIECIGA